MLFTFLKKYYIISFICMIEKMAHCWGHSETAEEFTVKKKRFLLQCVALVAAIAAFFIFRTYNRMRADTKAPEFSIDDEVLELSVSEPASALLQGITAEDNRDGDVTHSIVVESIGSISEDHTAVVTYAAFDNSGNVAKVRRNIRYTDYHSPRFTFEQAMSFSVDAAGDIMQYIGAQDVLEGDISRRVRANLVSDTGSLRSEGNHTVRLTVTNSLGDTAHLEIPVEVYAVKQYNATLKLSKYILYLPKGSDFDPENYLASFYYNGNTVSLSRMVPSGYSLKYDNTVDPSKPGTYAVNYTVTHEDRNVDYVGHSVLIVIIEE